MVKQKLKKQILDPRKQQRREPVPELKLEEEDDSLCRQGIKTNLKGGYDPYDRDPLKKAKKPATSHQRTDLRKLSEWIRLKREVEELKQKDDAEAEKSAKAKKR
ncbi:MAG: hypothetical protein ABIT36_05925 [Steroidobacteraceae bacterium]